MGKKKDNSQAMLAQSRELSDKARTALESVDLPDEEKLRIALQSPELVGLLNAETLGESELGNLVGDASLREGQMEALNQMQELSRTGLADEDRAALNQLRRSTESDNTARQNSILQNMAERGALDSGSQLAAQLSASQQATQRASEGADRLAQQAANTRRDALSRSAQMASQVRGQDYGEQSAAARARDEITRFNAMNRQNVNSQNLGARQNISNARTQTANQEHMHNKALGQQQFENQMRKQGAIANAYTGQANQLTQHAGMQPKKSGGGLMGALGGAASGASTGNAIAPGGWGAAIGGGVGALAGLFAEDGGVKGKKYMSGGIGGPQLMTGDRSIDSDPIKMEQLQAAADATKTPDQGSDFDMTKLAGALSGLSGMVNKEEPQQRKPTPSMIPNPYTQTSDSGAFDRLRKGMYAEGGVSDSVNIDAMLKDSYGDRRSMAYEDGGEGTITEGVSFSGDHTPDRINKAEMVHNVAGQNRINELLLELKQRRLDESLDEGDVSVNGDQQDALLDVARGDIELEDMPEEDMISAETPIGELIKMLSTSKRG